MIAIDFLVSELRPPSPSQSPQWSHVVRFPASAEAGQAISFGINGSFACTTLKVRQPRAQAVRASANLLQAAMK